MDGGVHTTTITITLDENDIVRITFREFLRTIKTLTANQNPSHAYIFIIQRCSSLTMD